MFLLKTARAGVSKWECRNVPAKKRFELEKSFKLSHWTNSTEREKVMIQDQNTHQGIKFSDLHAANPGRFWIYNWGESWNTIKQAGYLRELICLPPPPVAPGFCYSGFWSCCCGYSWLLSTMCPKSDSFFTFLILRWSVALNCRAGKSWSVYRQGELCRGAMRIITDARWRQTYILGGFLVTSGMGLRTPLPLEASWSSNCLSSGLITLTLKIQSLRIFLGFAVSHLQVKAYDRGDHLCHCEVNL